MKAGVVLRVVALIVLALLIRALAKARHALKDIRTMSKPVRPQNCSKKYFMKYSLIIPNVRKIVQIYQNTEISKTQYRYFPLSSRRVSR